ncbi:hypothetical protein F8M49_22660 [Rhodococcus zopfii]|uniref:Mycothiol-dependent maleylpyruvate isomerase metal-binding domain-containing protein n=1 Tax=Rhodococcus zopfii TaxID=43772 RepID=A0ABU3WU15_9NOCA|nr:hypothetical protein [Rhodococcus zopfii]
MTRPDYPALLRADTDRLLDVVDGRFDRPVPTCPGWSVERLVGHVGRVHRRAATWLATGGGSSEIETPPAPEHLADWVRRGARRSARGPARRRPGTDGRDLGRTAAFRVLDAAHGDRNRTAPRRRGTGGRPRHADRHRPGARRCRRVVRGDRPAPRHR